MTTAVILVSTAAVVVIVVAATVIIVAVLLLAIRLLSLWFLLRGDRRKLHDQLEPLWHGATGICHTSNGSLDLMGARHFSKEDARRVVVVHGVVGFLGIILLPPKRRVWWQPPVGGFLIRRFLGSGGLSGLAVDLLFDLHRGGGLVRGKPASRSGGRRSLGTSRRDGTIGDGGFLLRGFGTGAGSVAAAAFLGVAPRRGLGLILSAVGDDVVERFPHRPVVGAPH